MRALSTQCVLLSRLFLRDYSSDCFQILYIDFTDMEMCNALVLIEEIANCQNYRILKIYRELLHIRLNVHFGPGCLSLRDFSWDCFQILHIDSTDTDDMQRRSLD